jgi:hypothetical protein
MKIPLTYGVLIAIVNTIVTLVLFFLGYHSDAGKLASLGMAPSIIYFVVLIVGMALAVRARRAEVPEDQAFGYGSALGTAILAGVVSAVFGTLFYFLYLELINPAFVGVQLDMQTAKLAAKGLNAQQIEGARKMTSFFMKPPIQCVFALVMSAILSVVIGLIVAIFFRRPANPRAAAANAPVPPPLA